LKASIESIIEGSKLLPDGEVEIVVSDNASTDDTEKIVMQLQKRYQWISYFRNDDNISDRNFPLVLQKANGAFRKLSNDTLIYHKKSILFLCQLVKDNLEKKPILFFLNDYKRKTVISTDSFDRFVKEVSFRLTWLGGVGFWKEDCSQFDDFGCNEHLWQVPELLKEMENKKFVKIVKYNLVTTLLVKKKDISYGVFSVFYTHFLSFLKLYVCSGKLNIQIYDYVEQDLLFHFFLSSIVDSEIHSSRYILSNQENLKQQVAKAYKDKPYYLKFKQYFLLYRYIVIPLRRIKLVLCSLFTRSLCKKKSEL
jgi:glycosyltransferase involved in cell wall biosynthesis